MKTRASHGLPLLLAIAAALSIAHSLAGLAPADPDAFVDLGDGLLLGADGKVVEAWTLPGAVSDEDAAFVELTQSGSPWPALLTARAQLPLRAAAARTAP